MLLWSRSKHKEGFDTDVSIFCFKRDVSLQVNLPCWWCFRGPLPTYFQKLFSRLAGWLSFSQAVLEHVRAELLGYKRFSSLKLAAAHSGRESAYLATDCKGKGKTIIFPFHLFNYPVGDIDCIWVTLITKALLRLPSSARRLKVENKNIQFSKMHIFSLAGLRASRCQVSNCIRPYTAVYSTSRLHESGFSVWKGSRQEAWDKNSL